VQDRVLADRREKRDVLLAYATAKYRNIIKYRNITKYRNIAKV
jgi:hypothetical protein